MLFSTPFQNPGGLAQAWQTKDKQTEILGSNIGYFLYSTYCLQSSITLYSTYTFNSTQTVYPGFHSC